MGVLVSELSTADAVGGSLREPAVDGPAGVFEYRT